MICPQVIFFDNGPKVTFLLTLLTSASGLYSFTVFFIVETLTTSLAVKVNDANVCIGYGSNADFGNTGTCTAIVQLSAEDLVNVKIFDDGGGDGGVVRGDGYSGLSGHFLEPL